MQLNSGSSIEFLIKTIQWIVQVDNIPFVTAIVFLLNCVDLACKGLYDCLTIIDKLAGDVDVACVRCSNGCSLLWIVADGDEDSIFGLIRVDKRYALLLLCL
jgi:hypothetical protein